MLMWHRIAYLIYAVKRADEWSARQDFALALSGRLG
jgi:hypothetical protein